MLIHMNSRRLWRQRSSKAKLNHVNDEEVYRLTELRLIAASRISNSVSKDNVI